MQNVDGMVPEPGRSPPGVLSFWRLRGVRAKQLPSSILYARLRLEMPWETVYRLVKRIPRGRVTTYGELAKALRLPGGARAAGYAMAACPRGRAIPWQRVVGAGGRLLIREPMAGLQRRLLESEGIAVEGRTIDMKRHGWSPPKNRPRARKRKGAQHRPFALKS
jgi:methylated-DNA-protein-cysteine methyltransferase-like protein